MERSEAEAIYSAGREATVVALLKLSAHVDRLEAHLGRLEASVARQQERIERLEERLRQNPDNSSLPPSQDPRPPGGRRGSSGSQGSERRPGGQPGHPGFGRRLIASERVEEVIEHLPACCAGCGYPLGEEPAVGPVRRHQVCELPELAVRVEEHRLMRRRCPACGETTQATLPADVPVGHFGPRLCAAIGALTARYRLSRRQVAELCADVFGCQIATGTIDAVCQRLGATLEEPHERLLEAVRGAPTLCVDETGWKEGGERRALWGAFTPQHAVLRIANSRHRDEAEALIGDSEAIVSSDRWWAYNHLDPCRRQVCWAHLVRDFRFHAEGLGAQKEFGEQALTIGERVFSAWDDFQKDRDRRRLRRQIAPLKRELRALLEAQRGKRRRHTKRFATNLLKLWPALWTFVEYESVEPTNNAAERGLRPAVIHRRLSLGNQAEHGKRTTERLLSASITCRLQRRSLFTYLADVTQATIRGQPAPSLV